MISFFRKPTFSQVRQMVTGCREEALIELIQAADKIVREARWHPYRSQINELRIPLIKLKHASKSKPTTL